MVSITRLKLSTKLLVLTTVGVLLVAVLFLGTQRGGGEDAFSETLQGGELALTSVNRNYESLTEFVQADKAQSSQLLDAARLALENANGKLDSAKRTEDPYVLGMLDNYQRVAQASGVMAEGVGNLLAVNQNLTDAIYYYSQKDFVKASEQAAYCLQVLTPLLADFKASNTTLEGINVFYVPSGHRDRLTLGVSQFKTEMQIYRQYVLFLRTLLEGRDYLQKNAALDDYLRQLQSAITNEDYEAAQQLLEEISKLIQSLKNPDDQNAADTASELDPDSLGDSTLPADELKNRLRDLERLGSFENYLRSLQKYLEALRNLEQGENEQAEQAINEGLGILGQGQASDSELQGMYEGLRQSFNTLSQRIKGQSDQG